MPTFHGDTIYAETKVLDKTRVVEPARPRRRHRRDVRGYNQRGEEICYFRRKVMVHMRDAAPARMRPYASPE